MQQKCRIFSEIHATVLFIFFIFVNLTIHLFIYLFLYLFIYLFIWSHAFVSCITRFYANKNISRANSSNQFYFIFSLPLFSFGATTLIASLTSCSQHNFSSALSWYLTSFFSFSFFITFISGNPECLCETGGWWLSESELKTLQQMHFELITYGDFRLTQEY